MYQSITEKEMENFLFPLKFQKMTIPGTFENVYGRRLRKDLSFRIYSTIEGGLSRQSGKDAIRCVLFWMSPEGEIKIVGTEKKVLRVPTWKDNLSKRIINWTEMLGPICEKCNSPTTLRKNKKTKNKFYGCVNYPTCSFTKNVNERNNKEVD